MSVLRNMCDQHKLVLVLSIAKALYSNSMEHGIQHVERVLKWALKITSEEKLRIDPGILELAVYLHDLGRVVGDPHAYYSALIGRELLREAECDESTIEKVISAVEAHSFSYSKVRKTVEDSDLAKVLSDADKLDALGLIGFLRVFMYSERVGRDLDYTLKHFSDKILRLHLYMNYQYSRKVAEKYTERVKQLLELLKEELS